MQISISELWPVGWSIRQRHHCIVFQLIQFKFLKANNLAFFGPRTAYKNLLKVPKREIFVIELLILSDPIWVGDLRNEPKKLFV
jgi:hypothetical protein